MANDVLITPAGRKIEFKDSDGNVDAVIQTDASGNLEITNVGGDISIGDTTSDVYIGDGTNNVDIVFEQNGEIRGTSGVTVTVGASGATTNLAGTVQLGGTTLTATGTELNYTDGVTSNIQTQLNAKASTSIATTSANGLMSSSDKTKIDGIESLADVTDATNVAAAGALMDSEVTNLAQVKAFDSADYATAAQGSTADSALQNISEDTTPQLGGNLDTNGYGISFEDDKYLKFGSSDDITIGHFSSVSANIIDALGALCISSDSSIIFKKENLLGETLAQMIPDGAVTLFYNGGQKFETTSTGIKTSGNIDVNGAYTLPTSDGTDGQSLITDGSGVLSWATPANATDADRVDGYHIAVVSSLPSSPDANTIYYIT